MMRLAFGLVALAAGGLLIIACGGDGDDFGFRASPTAQPSPTQSVEPTAPPAPTPALTADANAVDAGVPAEQVHLGSGSPPALPPEDKEALARMDRAMLTAADLGAGYVQTRREFRPNFRLLEEAADPAALRELILASARVDGLQVQFDHPEPGGPQQLNAFTDLFANPTGAAIAVKRAAEFVDAQGAEPLAAPAGLGEQAAVSRFTFTQGVGYQVAFRRGRLTAGVLLLYLDDPRSPDEAVEFARRLEARLAGEGL